MKHQAKRLAKQLTNRGIPAVELQGNLSQNARERNLAEFRSGEAHVLVATDVAARGIHIDDVELVVHIDPPVEHKAYLHRSGRTARAGNAGSVVTICLPEQRGETRQLLKKAAIRVTPQSARSAESTIDSLVGEVAPHVDPKETQRKRTAHLQPQGEKAPGTQGASRNRNRNRSRNRGRGTGHGHGGNRSRQQQRAQA